MRVPIKQETFLIKNSVITLSPTRVRHTSFYSYHPSVVLSEVPPSVCEGQPGRRNIIRGRSLKMDMKREAAPRPRVKWRAATLNCEWGKAILVEFKHSWKWWEELDRPAAWNMWWGNLVEMSLMSFSLPLTCLCLFLPSPVVTCVYLRLNPLHWILIIKSLTFPWCLCTEPNFPQWNEQWNAHVFFYFES